MGKLIKIQIVLMLSLILFGCKYTSQAPQKESVVSINFDDGNVRVFTEALPIMERYGFRGTVFINSDRIGGQGKLSWSQVDSLVNVYHWEIGGHTPKHEDLNLLTYEQAETVISTDYATIKNHGINPVSFATPYGHCPAGYYEIISRYYKNVRTCYANAMRSPVNRKLISAYQVSYHIDPEHFETDMKQKYANQDNLIVLLFHDFIPGLDAYSNYKIEDFAEDMKRLHDMNVKVLPLNEALDYLEECN